MQDAKRAWRYFTRMMIKLWNLQKTISWFREIFQGRDPWQRSFRFGSSLESRSSILHKLLDSKWMNLRDSLVSELSTDLSLEYLDWLNIDGTHNLPKRIYHDRPKSRQWIFRYLESVFIESERIIIYIIALTRMIHDPGKITKTLWSVTTRRGSTTRTTRFSKE